MTLELPYELPILVLVKYVSTLDYRVWLSIIIIGRDNVQANRPRLITLQACVFTWVYYILLRKIYNTGITVYTEYCTATRCTRTVSDRNIN